MKSKKVKKSTPIIAIVIATLIISFGLKKIFSSRVRINEIFVNYDGVLNVTTLLLSFVSLASIYLLFIQLRSEHEKSRIEKANELLFVWSNEMTQEISIAKAIVEKFSEEQCRKLCLKETLKVSCSLYRDVLEATHTNPSEDFFHKTQDPKNKKRTFFRKKDKNKSGMVCDCKDKIYINKFCIDGKCERCIHCDTEIELTKQQVKRLRHLTIDYLNLLESILVAWQYSVADREIIEEEFEFLISPREGRNALEYFRIACGSKEKYPAIEIFCTQLENKAKEKLKERGNIV